MGCLPLSAEEGEGSDEASLWRSQNGNPWSMACCPPSHHKTPRGLWGLIFHVQLPRTFLPAWPALYLGPSGAPGRGRQLQLPRDGSIHQVSWGSHHAIHAVSLRVTCTSMQTFFQTKASAGTTFAEQLPHPHPHPGTVLRRRETPTPIFLSFHSIVS